MTLQVDQALDLDRADDLVGDQDVGDAAGRHHLGLAELGAGDAHGPGLDQPMGQRRDLHPLGVRAPVDGVVAEGLRHLGGVRFHDVEVDQQRRRVEGRLRLADDADGGGGESVGVVHDQMSGA